MNPISNFQAKYGLNPDGVIGPKTLNKIKEVFNISSIESLANFMGQCAHESANFKTTVENLNYSAAGLLKTFPKYFNSTNVNKYANQPAKIANRIYGNRLGNGPEASGDGYKHRGFGFIQLTGKNNQSAFAEYIDDLDIIDKPELIATEYPFESAIYFFDENDLWKFTKTVDYNSILKLSKAINLGNPNSNKIPNGLNDRIEKTNYYYKIYENY